MDPEATINGGVERFTRCDASVACVLHYANRCVILPEQQLYFFHNEKSSAFSEGFHSRRSSFALPKLGECCAQIMS